MHKKINYSNIILYLALFLLLFLVDAGLKGKSLVIIIGLMFAYIIIDGRLKINFGNMAKCLVVYYIYTTIVTLIFYKEAISISENIKHIIFYLLLLVFSMVIAGYININSFFKLIRNSALIISIFGIFELITHYPIVHNFLFNTPIHNFASSVGSNDYRVVIIFFHPIIYGVYLMFFEICLVFFPYNNKIFNAFAHIVILLNIYGTKSRSTWVAFALIVLWWFIRSQRSRILLKMNTVIVGITVIMGCVIGNFILGNPFMRILNGIYTRLEGSLEAGEGQIIRIETVLNSIKFWREGHFTEFIFGRGYSYANVFMKQHPIYKFEFVWDDCIDNQYFTIIHDSGIIGLILIVCILVLAIKRVWTTNISLAGKVANYSLIGYFFAMYFYESFNFYTSQLLFFVLIMISDTISNQENNSYFETLKKKRGYYD